MNTHAMRNWRRGHRNIPILHIHTNDTILDGQNPQDVIAKNRQIPGDNLLNMISEGPGSSSDLAIKYYLRHGTKPGAGMDPWYLRMALGIYSGPGFHCLLPGYYGLPPDILTLAYTIINSQARINRGRRNETQLTKR